MALQLDIRFQETIADHLPQSGGLAVASLVEVDVAAVDAAAVAPMPRSISRLRMKVESPGAPLPESPLPGVSGLQLAPPGELTPPLHGLIAPLPSAGMPGLPGGMKFPF